MIFSMNRNIRLSRPPTFVVYDRTWQNIRVRHILCDTIFFHSVVK